MENVNPILLNYKLKRPRKVKCPGCGRDLKEEINTCYHGHPFDTLTYFLCFWCGTWVCGCCGLAYVERKESGGIKLPPSAEVERLVQKVREQHGLNHTGLRKDRKDTKEDK